MDFMFINLFWVISLQELAFKALMIIKSGEA